MNEFRVTMSLKNNLLAQAREKLGLNQGQFAAACDVSSTEYGLYENLKKSPYNKHGVMYLDAQKICSFLGKEPEELWPEAVLKVKKNRVVKEMSAAQVMALTNPCKTPLAELMGSELQKAAKDALATLTPREQRILELRCGFVDGRVYTLAEIGGMYDVTADRIRCIEYNALMKLRHPSRLKKLKEFVDEDLETYGFSGVGGI